jgi:hypothetical protein
MPQDIVESVNSIIVADEHLVIEEFRVGAGATPAKMLPGTWVIADTLDMDIKEGSDEAAGVLGILMEKAAGAITDAYAVGDRARVITGGDGLVLARIITSGGNINPGTPLVAATSGLTKIQATGAKGAQGEIVAIGETIHANDGAKETNAVVRIKHGVLSY